MGKAARDVELAAVFRAEHDADPAAVGRAAAAQIHGDVKDLARDRAHELCLLVPLLKVQPAQHAAARAGLVILHERIRDAGSGKVGRPVGFHEIAARIAEALYVDDLHAGNIRG